jgi:hypothetical protein
MRQRIQTLFQNIAYLDHKTIIEFMIVLAVGVVCGLIALYVPVLWNGTNFENLFMRFMTNILWLSP